MVVVALSLRAGVLPAQVPELPGTLDASFDVLRGPDGLVHVLAEDSEGWIYVGGEFSGYGSRNVAYLARIDADGALDSEFDLDLNGPVYALRVLANDDLLVAGDFTSAAGKPAIWMADLELDQAGEYRLTASNELGFDETTIPLSIRPRPATPGQPDLSFFAMPPSRRIGLKA